MIISHSTSNKICTPSSGGECRKPVAAAPAVHILARSHAHTIARALHTRTLIYVWLYVAVEWSCGGRVGGRVGGRTIVYSADY